MNRKVYKWFTFIVLIVIFSFIIGFIAELTNHSIVGVENIILLVSIVLSYLTIKRFEEYFR